MMDKQYTITLGNIISSIVVITTALASYFTLYQQIEVLSVVIKHETLTREANDIWIKHTVERIENKLDKVLDEEKIR